MFAFLYSMALLCIDIGNTHTHYGVLAPDYSLAHEGEMPTPGIDHPIDGIPALLHHLRAPAGIKGVAFCSVVPHASTLLEHTLNERLPGIPVFHLTHNKKLGLPITYPHPAEIGQDRLANAVAAHALSKGTPSIVIDLGTAVTFDIITLRGGYEGGIIAPGIAVMRNYLHERTAQLPLLDDSMELPGMIGQSTIDAMRIGVTVGFAGMIQALLDKVLQNLAALGEPTPAIYITGGCGNFIQEHLRQSTQIKPYLTLWGLAEAARLNCGEPTNRQ